MSLLPVSHRTRKRDKRRHQKGSAVVEFAVVAPIFLGAVMSISELGWVFFRDTINKIAAGDAARLIKTGQIQAISTTTNPEAQRQALSAAVCRYAQIFGNCDTTVTVEVVTYGSFQALANDTTDIVCQNSSQTEKDGLRFDPGSDDSIVRVRICVLYDTFNPAIGMSLKRTQGVQDRLIVTELFRNEPFTKF